MLANLVLNRGDWKGRGRESFLPWAPLWFRTQNLARFYCPLKHFLSCLLGTVSKNLVASGLLSPCLCCSVLKFLSEFLACPSLAYLIVASPLVLDTRSNSFVASQFSQPFRSWWILMSSSLNLFSKGLQSLISLNFLFNYFSSLCHPFGLKPSLLSLKVTLFWLTKCPGLCTSGLKLLSRPGVVSPIWSIQTQKHVFR